MKSTRGYSRAVACSSIAMLWSEYTTVRAAANREQKAGKARIGEYHEALLALGMQEGFAAHVVATETGPAVSITFNEDLWITVLVSLQDSQIESDDVLNVVV